MEFTFEMPVKVIVGKDCIKKNAEIFSQFGKKALIVTDAVSAKLNGSLADVTEALDGQGIEHVLFDKVESNPTVEAVREGACLAKARGAQFILAIGGGSPMDAGKAISLLAKQDISNEELFSGSYGLETLPLLCVPTTSGTGSEVTSFAILTNHLAKEKSNLNSPCLYARVAFLDATYTQTIPKGVVVNTSIDAMGHAVESMLTVKSNGLTDAIARESLKSISGCFQKLLDNERDFETCEKMMYGSVLAGIAVGQTRTSALHAMGYPMTYFKEIAHGRTVGLLMAPYFYFTQKKNPGLIADILGAMGLKSVDELKNILDRLLGEKDRLTKEEIEEYASAVIKRRNIQNCKVKPAKEDLIEIYSGI